MCLKQTAKLLSAICAAYPYFNKRHCKMSQQDRMAVLRVWGTALADAEYKQTWCGLMQLIKTSKFAPSVAEVIQAGMHSKPDLLQVAYKPLCTK